MEKKDKTATTDTSTEGKRQPRKKVYQRVRETAIPQELHDHFKKDNYDLKLVRWCLHGEEDYRYLSRRLREGYEFVTAAEIPDWYKTAVKILDTKSTTGLIITGDLCLMKVDTDLRNSRRKAYQEDADREVASVDVHILEKKGFRNLGTKSKVVLREPNFQE